VVGGGSRVVGCRRFGDVLVTGGRGGLRPAARPRFFCWITLFSWTPSRTTISNVTHGDENHMLNTRFINAALPAKRDYPISL
jgi:hypothetical protein